jgi:toxin ParE1/3/4
MARFRLTVHAEADLFRIGEYTLKTWGIAQAARYLDGLEDCCQMLAERPTFGRRCDYIYSGLHHLEHAHHILFYRSGPDGIVVVRILHKDMLPERSAFDED